MGVATIIGHLVLILTSFAVLLRSGEFSRTCENLLSCENASAQTIASVVVPKVCFADPEGSLASGINCYQCVSTSHDDPFQCNEFLGSDVDLVPKSCDAVFGAQYCIKHTGRFEGMGIDCYQCSSSKSMYCSDNMIHNDILTATPCDHVFEASYCVKTVGLYGGGLGTKRFCSSLDLGNYCNYIRQPGDQLEYRSCVFTCSTDGCNLAESKRPHLLVTLLSLALLIAVAIF